MADDEDENNLYRWESGYEKSWEAIREDEHGNLESSVSAIYHRAKRRRMLESTQKIRLGMMRHLFIVIDFSEAMTLMDLKPTRQISILKLVEIFLGEYFDQNPISQLGIVITRNKRAEKLSELGGHKKRHSQALEKAKSISCSGEPSLQNSIEMAANTLKHAPSHVSKEIVIIYGSLTTCDPRDIHVTIENMKKENVRCSVIGLSGEMFICKKLCKETNGVYGVIMDETHCLDLLRVHVNPPPSAANQDSCLIRMGFPRHTEPSEGGSAVSLCMCHLDSNEAIISSGGYFCPQCKSKYCELPVECKVCGLTLAAASHLARSYHHLFPLDLFKETPLSDSKEKFCFACKKEFTEPLVYLCGECDRHFCITCDLYIHESLHSCPGCILHVKP